MSRDELVVWAAWCGLVLLAGLLALGCLCAVLDGRVTPPDDTAARMAAQREMAATVEAQKTRVDLAITKVELHQAQRGHRWAVTANGSRTVTYCLHCGVQYHTPRQIGGMR